MGDDFKFRRSPAWPHTPPALLSLILINTGISAMILIVSLIGLISGSHINLSQFLVLPAAFSSFIFQPWTLLTYMFTHVSLLHFIFNMLWLYWFGSVCLDACSGKNLVYIYLAGGVSGGVLYLLVENLLLTSTLRAGLCGASAAVIALMTVAAFRFPDRRFHLFLIGEVKLKWIAAISVALMFFGAGGGANIGGSMAHIGGIVAGLCFVFIRYPRKKRRKISPKMRHVISNRLNDSQRLDQLLDRIRLSGYASLSKAEKIELQQLSKRLNRH